MTGFAAQLRLKWWPDTIFSLSLFRFESNATPQPPNSVVCFQIQFQVINLGLGLRFAAVISSIKLHAYKYNDNVSRYHFGIRIQQIRLDSFWR